MRRSAVQSSWNDHRVNRSGRALFNARSTHARANYDFVRQANRARAKQRPTNSRSWGTWRELQAKPLKWWAHKGSNLGPLPCEGNALPLSYAPGNVVLRQWPDDPTECVTTHAVKSPRFTKR